MHSITCIFALRLVVFDADFSAFRRAVEGPKSQGPMAALLLHSYGLQLDLLCGCFHFYLLDLVGILFQEWLVSEGLFFSIFQGHQQIFSRTNSAQLEPALRVCRDPLHEIKSGSHFRVCRDSNDLRISEWLIFGIECCTFDRPSFSADHNL